MPKALLSTVAAALLVQATGAMAATGTGALHASTTPHTSLVAICALIGMGFLVLMARAPLRNAVEAPATAPTAGRRNWKAALTIWPHQRAIYALLAIIAVSGSLGFA